MCSSVEHILARYEAENRSMKVDGQDSVSLVQLLNSLFSQYIHILYKYELIIEMYYRNFH